MDALTVSVGFFAVADVRPTRERQADYCCQSEASEHDSWEKAIMKESAEYCETTI